MIVSRSNAPHYIWGADCDGWHLLQSPELSVIHERMPAGTSEVRHYHPIARQFFFVLAGKLTMELAGRHHEVDAGTGIQIEPLAPHQAINASDKDVEFLVISHPPTRGDRIDV